MFFASMSVAMLGVKYKSDKRDIHLHHGNYLLKLLAWFAFTAVTFLFPNSFVEAYGGSLARRASESMRNCTHRTHAARAVV